MHTPAPLPETIGSRYRPLRLVGQGGMGAVYEVEHLHTGEHLALKVLLSQAGASPEIVERFKREARASAKIRSNHVVRVTDADAAPELSGAPFLVMELLQGGDLDVHCGEHPQSPSDVVMWLRQVARALDKAHALGIVHRDLKPENLFLTAREDGTPLVKILDFGIAKMAQDANSATKSGQIVGTPKFMAPEQAKGQSGLISPATDLFALGLIGFRLLTGRDYWTAETMVALIAQIVYEPMSRPSDLGVRLGAAFDEWFMKACSRDISERFPSGYEQVEALAEALGMTRVAAISASTPGITATPSRMPTSHAETVVPLAASGSSSSANITQTGSKGVPLWSLGVALAVGLGVATVGFFATRSTPTPPANAGKASAQPTAPTEEPAPKESGEPMGVTPAPSTSDSATADTSAKPANTAAKPPSTKVGKGPVTNVPKVNVPKVKVPKVKVPEVKTPVVDPLGDQK